MTNFDTKEKRLAYLLDILNINKKPINSFVWRQSRYIYEAPDFFTILNNFYIFRLTYHNKDNTKFLFRAIYFGPSRENNPDIYPPGVSIPITQIPSLNNRAVGTALFSINYIKHLDSFHLVLSANENNFYSYGIIQSSEPKEVHLLQNEFSEGPRTTNAYASVMWFDPIKMKGIPYKKKELIEGMYKPVNEWVKKNTDKNLSFNKNFDNLYSLIWNQNHPELTFEKEIIPRGYISWTDLISNKELLKKILDSD